MHSKRGISQRHSTPLPRCNRIVRRVYVLLGLREPRRQDKAVLFIKISKHCKVRCKPMIWLGHNRHLRPFSTTCNRLVTPIMLGITMEEDRAARNRHWRVMSVDCTVAAVASPR